MSEDLSLGPELGGLLAELAQEPERMVLGWRARSFQDLLSPDGARVATLTGVGALEAHLVRVHREELAYLLLAASYVRLAERNAPMLTPRDEHARARRVDPKSWSRRAHALRSGRLSTEEVAGPMVLLGRALSADGTEPSARDLAIASLRLVPSTTTGIWVGVHCGLEGDYSRAIEFQRGALSDSPRGPMAGYAWSNIARESAKLGRYQDALEAGRKAWLAADGLARGSVAWFLAAVQAGQLREALRAARALAERMGEGCDELEEQIEFTRQGRARGAWRPTRGAQAIASQHPLGLPLAAERLLEIFA